MLFENLLKECSRVIVVAHSVGGKEGKREIHELFTEEKDGTLVPLKKKIRLIENSPEIDVPDYTIHHLSGIILDEIELELETDVFFEEDDDNNISIHTQMKKKNPFSSSNHIKVKMKYKMAEIAEGLHLIRDKLNQQLSSILNKKPN